MTFVSLGMSREEIGKKTWKEDMRRGGRVITYLHTFSVTCATFGT